MDTYKEYIKRIDREIEDELQRESSAEEIPEFQKISSEVFGYYPKDSLSQTEDASEYLSKSNEFVQRLYCKQVFFYRELTYFQMGKSNQLVIFCKRVIRKLVSFLLVPMVSEINLCRGLTVSALEEINQQLALQEGYGDAISTTIKEIEKLKEEKKRLVLRMEQLEAVIEKQQKKEK